MRIVHYAIAGLLLAAVSCGPSLAWDFYYGMSVVPSDASLGANRWSGGGDISMASTDGDILHIADGSSQGCCFYGRIVPQNSPVTVEARVRVDSGSTAFLEVATASFLTRLMLGADQLQVGFASAAMVPYSADLSQFRTVRVATDSGGSSYVWLDGVLVSHGAAIGHDQGGIAFGGLGTSTVQNSYWDYVAYSNAFLPVPEPSSLLALVGGLAGLGGFGLRRRRNH